jgi:predicted transcriptional regulator
MAPKKISKKPTRQALVDQLRTQINLGIDQANRGELLDGEEVFEELEKRFQSAPPCP